jgi:hypothetical protein
MWFAMYFDRHNTESASERVSGENPDLRGPADGSGFEQAVFEGKADQVRACV